MYQFMVGATTTPRVTRMAMTSGTNKWASRAVVILQLAAWSAVGIVLLQKGVTSLQKAPTELNNVTQIIPLNLPSTSPSSEESLSVLPLQDAPAPATRQPKNLKFPPENWRTLDPEDEPRVLESVESSFNKNPEKTPSPEEVLANKLYYLKKVKKRTKLEELEELAKKLEAEELQSNETKSKVDENREKSPEKTGKSLEPAKNHQKVNETNATNATTPTKPEGIWESRRRVRLSHLSGGGAAAAVAMVAVGAVMLILGPAVIVLRALDERRQERRFLKLSGRDDLPPTYEQATLMDEAPRYSSLSLNTILGPPPPPSPTPVRAHLV